MAAMGEPKRRATYEDLMQVPDTKVAEIIDGELIVSPQPATPHTHAASVLGADVLGPFHRAPGDPPDAGGWWILLEPELLDLPVEALLWVRTSPTKVDEVGEALLSSPMVRYAAAVMTPSGVPPMPISTSIAAPGHALAIAP